MDNSLNLEKVKEVYPLFIKTFKDFVPPDEKLDLTAKLNSMISYLNQTGKLTNDVVKDWNKVMDWFLNGGLDELIKNEINVQINTEVMNEIGQNFDSINEQLAEITTILKSVDEFARQVPENDDTGRIQRALDYFNNLGGGTLSFPRGTYEISSSLFLYANIKLIGLSKDATVIESANDISLIKSSDPSIRMDNISIMDLSFKRYGINGVNPIIDFSGISHSSLFNVKIDKTGGMGAVIGIKAFELTYYNLFSNVKISGCSEGYGFYSNANANIIIGGTVISCDKGFVIDNTNSIRMIGGAVEDGISVGVLIRNGSKNNSILGVRAENIPICFRVEYSKNPAFDNYIIAPIAYPSSGGTKYDIQTSNVLLETIQWGKLNNLDLRSASKAYKNAAQASLPASTWTKVTFEGKYYDNASEYDNATSKFTVIESGLYEVKASVLWNNVTSNNVAMLGVYINGVRQCYEKRVTGGSESFTSEVSTRLKLNAGDYVEIYGNIKMSCGITSGGETTYFEVIKLV